MGPMNYNNACYWVHLMCKEIFMLWMIISYIFKYSLQPNFSTLVIIQMMIVTKSQMPNCGSNGHCYNFNTLKKKMICVRRTLVIYVNFLTWVWEQNNIWGLAHMHNNLEWHTNWPKLMQLWQKIILIPSRLAICERGYPKQNENKMQSKDICAI